MLILSPRFSPDSRALDKAAASAGWETERLHQWKIPEGLANRNDICVHGEPLFGEFLVERLGLVLLEPQDNLLQNLPDVLRKREIKLMKYMDARQETTRKFIKPPNFKNFQARVYETGADLPVDDLLNPIDVLVSEVVSWEVEFRCFILNGKVVDCSAYSRDGRLNLSGDETEGEAWPASDFERSAALEFAAEAIAAVELPAAVALDVGQIAGRGWAVVEANSAWASGLYGCDPMKILPVLRRASTKA